MTLVLSLRVLQMHEGVPSGSANETVGNPIRFPGRF